MFALAERSGKHDATVWRHEKTNSIVAAPLCLCGSRLCLPPIASNTNLLHCSLLLSCMLQQSSAKLLALASAAVSNLLPGASSGAASAPTAADAADAAAGTAGTASAAHQPGALLKAQRTRLILFSQLPLVQLLDSLPAAASPESQGNCQLGLKGCPSIALPALRARSSDIPLLAVAAGHATAALRGYSGIRLTASAEMQLTSYEFPGNEAELQGLVQRAIMLHPPAAAAAVVTGSTGLQAPPCIWEGEEDESGVASSAAEGQGSRQPLLTLDGGDFWAATGDADRGRVDVLEVLPWLRKYILETGEAVSRQVVAVAPRVLSCAREACN